mmetsp:Transcript_1995/g.4758  ORF Transcript_1995/g.4758 Transcript_1995/m.4758 type:complete len:248 (-) Transcript_1995:681-1424(-)
MSDSIAFASSPRAPQPINKFSNLAVSSRTARSSSRRGGGGVVPDAAGASGVTSASVAATGSAAASTLTMPSSCGRRRAGLARVASPVPLATGLRDSTAACALKPLRMVPHLGQKAACGKSKHVLHLEQTSAVPSSASLSSDDRGGGLALNEHGKSKSIPSRSSLMAASACAAKSMSWSCSGMLMALRAHCASSRRRPAFKYRLTKSSDQAIVCHSASTPARRFEMPSASLPASSIRLPPTSFAIYCS